MKYNNVKNYDEISVFNKENYQIWYYYFFFVPFQRFICTYEKMYYHLFCKMKTATYSIKKEDIEREQKYLKAITFYWNFIKS